MKSIIFKAGEEATNALHMLSKFKHLDPTYFELDYLNNFNIERYIDEPLSVTIPKAITRIEEANTNASAIIFPADIKENGMIASSIIIVIHNNVQEFDVTISIKYRFENNKIKISKYQLIDYNNLFEAELKDIENEFVEGLLSPKYAMDIWLKSSIVNRAKQSL